MLALRAQNGATLWSDEVASTRFVADVSAPEITSARAYICPSSGCPSSCTDSSCYDAVHYHSSTTPMRVKWHGFVDAESSVSAVQVEVQRCAGSPVARSL